VTDKIIFLKDEFKTAWANQDVFACVENISGEIYREFANRKTLRFELNGKAYFIKIHRGIGLRETFKNIVAGKRPTWGAEQEWIAIHKLKALNINTMTPVAFGKRGVLPWRQHSFIVTEALDNTLSLEDISLDWKKNPPPFLFKKALIEQVALISKTLHEHGVNHCDYYICHFLWNVSSGKQNPLLYLIDLHRTQIRITTPVRWIIKDIGSLYFSAMTIDLTKRDGYRFIKKYTGLPLKLAFANTTVWQNIICRARQLYKKEFHQLPVN
jgi:heptose I phosphotransferase